MKYGIIADIEHAASDLPRALATLQHHEIDKLIINGDFSHRKPTLPESMDYVDQVLQIFHQTGKETWIVPGNKESVRVYQDVVQACPYTNIIDAHQELFMENKDHHLLFIPGTDMDFGEFHFGSKYPTNLYVTAVEGHRVFTNWGNFYTLANLGQVYMPGVDSYVHLADLEGLITKPDKTIAVCHLPRRFSGAKRVDHAEFIETSEGIIPAAQIKPVFMYGQGLSIPGQITRANRGSSQLQAFYNKTGITKAVSAHFDESSHHAHDGRGTTIAQGKQVSELYWHAGSFVRGHVGILTVDGSHVSYENLSFK